MMIPILCAACFLAAFALSAGTSWMELGGWRKSAGRLWTDRARILWPVSNTRRILAIYVPLLLAAGSSLLWQAGLLELVPRWFSAYLGFTAGGWFFTRQLFPGITLWSWIHETIAGRLLNLMTGVILVVCALNMPRGFTLQTWLLFAATGILLSLWFMFSPSVLRMLRILHPPDRRLSDIVASCTRDGGPRVKHLWKARSVTANAFAIPLAGTLIFTDELLGILDDDEVAAVCSHEMGHLTESGTIIFSRYLGALGILPYVLAKPAYHALGSFGIALLILASIFWGRLSNRLSLRLEQRADASAVREQAAEGTYARALEKIYRHDLMPAAMERKNLSHPDLYDRMLAAGVTPDFPEPPPPERFTPLGWVMIFGGPFLLIWIFKGF